MSFTVNVKFRSTNVPVEVQSSWCVRDIKKSISQQQGISANEIRLIFAGHELLDDQQLEEFDIGDFSVIQAIQGCVWGETKSSSQTFQAPEYKSQYYVYCKSPCGGVQPGKLRVRCHQCKQDSLTVSTEPNCWNDVLTPGAIRGHCQLEGCPGSVAEFYFKCAKHSSTDSSVVLCLIKPNTRDVSCVICDEIQNPVLVFPCEDRHCICLDCFKSYCLTSLNERSFIIDPGIGSTLACPAGCENSLIKEVHHFRILGDEQYERYKQFGAEDCLLQTGGVFCPSPGCGAGLYPSDDNRRVVCEGPPGCGHIFCKNCQEVFHEGDCNQTQNQLRSSQHNSGMDTSHADRARWDSESKETITQTTKPCPHCNVPVEKAGGCMHMICSRCKHQWCWLCRTEWNRECLGNHWFG